MSIRPAVVSLLAALTLAACGGKKDAKASAELPTRPVRVVPVSTGVVRQTVEVVGELQGIEEVKVFPMVPERIRSLPVKEGDRVRQGEVLAVLHGELQNAAVSQTEGALEAARANRDNLAESIKRVRQLVTAGSASKSQLDTLEAQFRAAEAQVQQANAAMSQASAQRGRTVITAPISGVVAQVMLKQGDLASGQMPIMTVVRGEKLKAVFRVPERDFLQVREGQPVTLSPLAAPDQAVQTTVSVRGPVVDRMTRTGLIEVHVDNASGALLPGTSVRATLELSRREGAILVPAEAVLLTTDTERTGKAVAFVTDGKTAARREVVVGVRQEDALEIKEGLEAGDSLIVQGAHFLRDGNPVKVMDPGQKQENG